MNTGFSAPANDKYNGNSIYLIVKKTGNRVDDVTLAAVLHIDYRNFTGCKMIPGCKRRTVALIGSDDMMMRINTISRHQIVTQCL